MKKIGILVLVLGICLIAYPLIADIVFSFNHSVAISNYQENVKSTNDDELKKKKEDLKKYNEELVNSEKGQVASGNAEEQNELTSYLNLLNIGDVLGYIEIPKINVNLPIYHGSNSNVLNFGIGHMENTSFPNGMIGTHGVLAGHSGLTTARIFDDIDKMEIDDIFYITTLDEKFAYRVDQIKIVTPSETEHIEIQKDKELVTLVTCVPVRNKFS